MAAIRRTRQARIITECREGQMRFLHMKQIGKWGFVVWLRYIAVPAGVEAQREEELYNKDKCGCCQGLARRIWDST